MWPGELAAKSARDGASAERSQAQVGVVAASTTRLKVYNLWSFYDDHSNCNANGNSKCTSHCTADGETTVQ